MRVRFFDRDTVKFFLLIVGLHSFSAGAQSSLEVDQAVQESIRLQQQEAQRLNEQFKKDRGSAASPTRLPSPEPSLTVRPESRHCRKIETIETTGVTHLSARQLADITNAYAQRCLGVSEIESLLGEITRAYIEKGWVSARVYLPQQDLSVGVLKLLVVEGKVSEIKVEDGGKGSISVGNVAPFVQGHAMNLRDIEQALDQINRLSSNSATVEMLPGENPGETVLVFRNQPRFPLHLHVSMDNHGSETTGSHQLSAALSLDNPLGFNDFVSYFRKQTAPLNDRQRFSTSESISYVIPFGYSTVSFNGSYSRYASSFSLPSGSKLSNSGQSINYAVRWDRVIARTASTIWNAYVNVSTKDSSSYLEGVLLSTASRKIAAVDLGASVNTTAMGGVLGLDVGYSKGVPWFGALRDNSLVTAMDPKAQFGKWVFSANFQKPFKVFEKNLDFSSQWSGQYAQDVLYGSEQMMIGSLYSVRGFSQNSLSGDHGLNIRNEIGMRTPFDLRGMSGSVRTWMGLDYGMVRNRNAGVAQGALTGLAAGVQIHTKQRISLDIFATKPLSKPSGMDFEPTRWWLRLSAAL